MFFYANTKCMKTLTFTRRYLYNRATMNGKLLFLIGGFAVVIATAFAIGFTVFSPCVYAGAAFAIAEYQIVIRAVVFKAMQKCAFKPHLNGKFFGQKKWEARFYRLIKLHSIKDLLPAYGYVDARKDIVGAIRLSCVTEISNAVIIPLSYLPLIYAAIARSQPQYIVSIGVLCLMMSVYDLFMLFAQRYNRFRMKEITRRLSRCQ